MSRITALWRSLAHGFADFRRDWRYGEITLLWLALVLAVTATSSLRFFSSAVDHKMQREASALIAADLALQSTRVISGDIEALAKTQGLTTANTLQFSSVLIYGDNFQLTAVKAVTDNYPLRGQLRLQNNDLVFNANGAPKPGELWADARLMQLLNARIGDEVQVGEQRLRISAMIAHDPAQGSFSLISPHALMNMADVAATKIIQPGARLRYQLLLRGDADAISSFRKAAEPFIPYGSRWFDLEKSRPEIGGPLQHSERYFSLASLAAVILAGLAIQSSARRFAERHFDSQALLRCLGASRREAGMRLLSELIWIGLSAVVVGAICGWLSAELLAWTMRDILSVSVGSQSIMTSVFTGVITAVLCLLGFALSPLQELHRISPLRVLRRDWQAPSWSQRSVALLAWVAMTILMMVQTGDWQLTVGVMLIGGVVLWLFSQGLLKILIQLRRRITHPIMASWVRDPQHSNRQLLGLSLGIAALLMVFTLRDELFNAWLEKLPADAPNQFILNIAPDEREPLQQILQREQVSAGDFYPVVRGRLVTLNGKPLQEPVSKENDQERDESLNRELSLTWRTTLADDTVFQSGQPWSANEPCEACVSIEQKLAKRLNIKLNDTLGFSMAEGNVTVRVTSIREVDWNTFKPNFYFIFSPGVLDAFPSSYLTSFRLAETDQHTLTQVMKSFPTLVLLDVRLIMAEVRRLLDQVSQAIEAVLMFVVIASGLVISAQLLAGFDQRRQEAALLRTLGLNRHDLQKRLFMECLFMGAAAGFIAALLNEVIAAFMYSYVLETTPRLHLDLWWQAPLLGAMVTLLATWPIARPLWRVSPLRVLRQS